MAELCDDYMERQARPMKRKTSTDGDESLIRTWSDRCSNFLFQPVLPDREAMAAEQKAILDAQQVYFGGFIRERRARPGADMISAMVQAEVNGERLSDLEILANCNMMTTAGGGTSRSAISLSLIHLKRFPVERKGGCGLSERPEVRGELLLELRIVGL